MNPPTKRKPGPQPAPTEQQRKVRHLRLNDADWDQLKALGGARWIERELMELRWAGKGKADDAA